MLLKILSTIVEMRFKAGLLIVTITISIIAITSIFILAKKSVYNAVSKTANDNAKNLLDMAMVSIENQYTSLIFHREYSYNIRKEERQNIVAIAMSNIKRYYDDYRNGKISEQEAKRLALKSINEFRYDDGNGYIWINDTQKPIPHILIHPIYPEYNNKISTAPIFFSSSDSSNIPRLAADLCEREGGGFIEYFWSKPNNSQPTGKIPKISYVKLFEPWQWVLGTGVYLEDIENDVQNRLDAIIYELSQTVGKLLIAETGYFYIFNSNREVLLHPLLNKESGDSILRTLEDKIPYDGVMQAEKTKSKTYEYLWYKPTKDKQEYVYKKKVFVEYFEPMDWYVCASIYEDELSRPGTILGKRILYISIIFLFITIAISIRLSSSIAKPLNNLANMVSRIPEKNKVDIAQIPISGSYETRELGRVIRGMLESIEEQKNNLIKAKLEAEESERKLSENEEKYRLLFESSNDAILLIENNKIIDFNHKTLELFECDNGYILKKTLDQLSPENQPDGEKSKEKSEKLITEVLQGSSRILEWKHLKQSGEIFDAMVSVSYVELDEKSIVQAVLRDITERKKTEKELANHRNNLEKLVAERTNDLESTNEELTAVNEELYNKNEIVNQQKEKLEATITQLKEAHSKLLHAEKMASLGVLTAGVAHEINNPLNFILGGSTGLENILGEHEITKDPRIKTIIKSLKTGAERIAAIVKGLNQFSREKDVYDENCQIHSIIDNCLTILHNQYKNRIEVKKKYLEKTPVITGNVGKMHQVFLNIIQNAIHAIKEEGTITIKTKTDSNNLIVEISDTGTGISKGILNKITDPFFTTKDPGKGTGLGLSITYSIIQEHNGEIEFISEEGIGTTVKIVLPFVS